MNAPFKKVLIAVDGSQASIDAARMALELAEACRAQVAVVHVTPPIVLALDMPTAPAIDLRETELALGANVLEAVVTALGRRDLPVKNLLGSPAFVIADVAEQEGFDLIVVGNRGRNGVSRVLLGSVADRLVHISKCAVLVVR